LERLLFCCFGFLFGSHQTGMTNLHVGEEGALRWGAALAMTPIRSFRVDDHLPNGQAALPVWLQPCDGSISAFLLMQTRADNAKRET